MIRIRASSRSSSIPHEGSRPGLCLTPPRRPKIDETGDRRLHGDCEAGVNERGNNVDGGSPCCRRLEIPVLSPVEQ